MITLVLILTAVGGLIGFLTGRWIAVLVAGAAWPAYVFSRKEGLWGHGVGDGWEIALIVGAVVATLGAIAGVLLRKRAANAFIRSATR
jgi:uncharacterized membrane protein (UPF0136 family)